MSVRVSHGIPCVELCLKCWTLALRVNHRMLYRKVAVFRLRNTCAGNGSALSFFTCTRLFDYRNEQSCPLWKVRLNHVVTASPRPLYANSTRFNQHVVEAREYLISRTLLTCENIEWL